MFDINHVLYSILNYYKYTTTAHSFVHHMIITISTHAVIIVLKMLIITI